MNEFQYQKLLSMSTEPESFVRNALQSLEADFRQMALIALADWEQTGLVSPDIFEAVGLLQRPSWGMWNGLISSLKKARKSVLRTAGEMEREKLDQAKALQGVLELFDTRLDEATINAIQPLANFCRVTLEDKARVGQILSLPITVRNRMVHDIPSDPKWWEDTAAALKPLIEYCSVSKNTYFSQEPDCYSPPWFINDDGQTWSFNGLEKDNSVIYVSSNGKTIHSEEYGPEIIKSFQRLLGKTEIQENNFRKLLSKLAPEEVKGVLIGDYLVGKPIGTGGFATVHIARQLSTGRKVAMKLLRDGMSEEVKMRFKQEAQYLSQFRNPQIVTVYGYGEEPWSKPRAFSLSDEAWFKEFSKTAQVKAFIALEWINGQSLEKKFSLIQQTRPSIYEITRWFEQAANALVTVHSAGLIHRDVKPSNLMITEDGRIVLLDFGVARSQQDVRTLVTATGQSFGTPAYMSPEQIRAVDADAEVGPHTDIYSLCATFYELYSGERLYDHDTESPDSVKLRKLKGEHPKVNIRGLPWELRTILIGGLELEVSDRFETMSDLAIDLRHFIDNEPIKYRKPSLLRRANLGYRRNRVVSNLLISFLFIACIGVWLYVKDVKAERKIAEDNRDLANEKSILANLQKSRAEENYKLARETVDRFFTRVSEEELFNTHGLQPLQKKLLEDALDYYRTFLQKEVEDDEVRIETAMAMERVGHITNLIGNRQEAVDSYKNALTIWENLVSEDRNDRNSNYGLSNCLSELGIVYWELGESEKALELLQKSFSLAKDLMSKYPDDEEIRTNWKIIVTNLGPFQRKAGKYDEAKITYDAAWNTWKNGEGARPRPIGVVFEPNAVEQGTEKGMLITNVIPFTAAELAGIKPGDLLTRLNGVPANKFQSVRESIAKLKAGEQVSATIIRNKELIEVDLILQQQTDLFITTIALNSGILSLEVYRDVQGALKWFNRARQLCELMSQYSGAEEGLTQTENQTVQELGIRIYDYLGYTQSLLGNHKQAFDHYEEGLILIKHLSTQNPTVTNYQSDLALHYANLGSLYGQIAKNDKAEEMLLQATRTLKELVEKHPATVDFKERLGSAYNDLGVHYLNQKRYADAYSNYTKALSAFPRVENQKNKNVKMRFKLASIHTNSGWSLIEQGLYEDAKEHYKQAIQILTKLSSELTDRAEAQAYEALSSAHYRLAMIFEKLGSKEEAEQSQKKAQGFQHNHISALENLLGHNTNDKSLRIQLATQLNNLANIILDQNRTDARILFERILKVYKDPKTTDGLDEYESMLVSRAHGNLGWIDILEKGFKKSREHSRIGLSFDGSQLWIKQNLALALLFDGQYQQAEEIYLDLKNNSSDQDVFIAEILKEFSDLRKKGLSHPDMKKIEQLMND